MSDTTQSEYERRAIIALARAWLARNDKTWAEFLPRDVVEELARTGMKDTPTQTEKDLYPRWGK